ncbi:hypothetical protein J3R82DRAFT_7631 [Butyriboletus roseoflavus]|nr:hypothetical protein J3R82DRAFT_7631 [Butyriboletus roseoflavus]
MHALIQSLHSSLLPAHAPAEKPWIRPYARFESAVVHVSAAVDVTKDSYAVARDFLSQHDVHRVTDHATGVTQSLTAYRPGHQGWAQFR